MGTVDSPVETELSDRPGRWEVGTNEADSEKQIKIIHCFLQSHLIRGSRFQRETLGPGCDLE